ncbi:hypothetical protein JGU66_29735 [Myxococcaceae bacterium JPH2]|nr:hypothetical protein [Myxococcaceae bacterium JPH2]
MTAPQDTCLLVAYSPALSSEDTRPMAVVHEMERAIPGLNLSWTLSDEGLFIPAPPRESRDTAKTARGRLPLLCNGDEGHFVTLSRRETPASQNPGGQPLFEVHAKWPLDVAGISAAAETLERVAEATHAFWAHATPQRAAGDIAEQTSPTLAGPPSPPHGLPALKLPWEIRSPEVPHRLGWLNYWSAATTQRIGFPNPSLDADLLSRARRTATGGWVVRLTDTPLDLDNPAHLDALLRAYERFPEIGGRTALKEGTSGPE